MQVPSLLHRFVKKKKLVKVEQQLLAHENEQMILANDE